jgi:S-formylglutathione hydrolase FrmB
MGGYGAFKLALRCPEKFAAAASLSGALDMAGQAKAAEKEWRTELERVFGDLGALAGNDNDLLHLAAKIARSTGPRPALYQWCGTGDFLYQDNLRFRDHARRVGLALTYEEGPGTHEWSYWDRQIQRVLEWLPLKRNDQ